MCLNPYNSLLSLAPISLHEVLGHLTSYPRCNLTSMHSVRLSLILVLSFVFCSPILEILLYSLYCFRFNILDCLNLCSQLLATHMSVSIPIHHAASIPHPSLLQLLPMFPFAFVPSLPNVFIYLLTNSMFSDSHFTV
jgi:hypothetical protein